MELNVPVFRLCGMITLIYLDIERSRLMKVQLYCKTLNFIKTY